VSAPHPPLFGCRPHARRPHAPRLGRCQLPAGWAGPIPHSFPPRGTPQTDPLPLLLVAAPPIKATEHHRHPFSPLHPFLSHSNAPRAPLLPIASYPPSEHRRHCRNQVGVPPPNPLPSERHPRSSSCRFIVPLTLLLHLRCCMTPSTPLVTTGAAPTAERYPLRPSPSAAMTGEPPSP
jgi:hypothetical protein